MFDEPGTVSGYKGGSPGGDGRRIRPLAGWWSLDDLESRERLKRAIALLGMTGGLSSWRAGEVWLIWKAVSGYKGDSPENSQTVHRRRVDKRGGRA